MPKSKNKIVCPICNKTFSASVFKRHVFLYAKHLELINEVYKQKEVFLQNRPKCLSCGLVINIDLQKLDNEILLQLVGCKVQSRVLNVKFCSKKCIKNIPWNKGLSKENNDILKFLSESRMGQNNPIHKVLQDPEVKALWIKNIEKSGVWERNAKTFTGKTLEERYGKEKADKIKKENSEWCKTRKPHKGYKHSEETKNKLRETTSQWHVNNEKKVSKDEKFLFETLVSFFPNEIIQHQFLLKYYTIDIAFPEYKFAIEVDGDFWHANEQQGYLIKFECQKKNKINDQNKNKFLIASGWTFFRVWVSQIENELSDILERIGKHLCEKKILLK